METDPPAAPHDRALHDLTLGGLRLQELVDRDALRDMVRSFHALFGISLRVFAADGFLVAESASEQAICKYVGSLSEARVACMKTVAAAKRCASGAGADATHPCFTGAQYRIFSIDYDARPIGKAILGPYLPVEVNSVPKSLMAVDPAMDPAQAMDLLPRMPRARAETITLICEHLRRTLDLILFSGHKSLVTSQMHLSSVRESYRELSGKNEKLQEAFDRLRELDRLKSNFLGVISHELRTPLTSIIGYSEMLIEGIAGPLVGDQRKFVDTIHEKGEQLLALIMSLLDLSKLESGTMALRKGAVDLHSLLNDVASTIEPKARKKSISLECQVEGELPRLQGDADRLRQVFVNLADNAVKFSPAGEVVRLLARWAPLDAEEAKEGFSLLVPSRRLVEVQVQDRGIGIPEQERERVFDPFYQVDSSSTREHEGTGLGLSIVKRLVEAHGGKVSVAANEPNGTILRVMLPATPLAGTMP
jgi:two-component system sensor histidine kinase BarA